MGIFSSIKNAIWGKAKAKDAAKPSVAKPAAPKPTPAVATTAPKPVAIDEVDVAALLEDMADESGQQLNWKISIVDLMKLLDLDSSLAARKELAEELGYAGARDGSAEMNIWLHKAVMKELAKNGGKVPADMLD